MADYKVSIKSLSAFESYASPVLLEACANSRAIRLHLDADEYELAKEKAFKMVQLVNSVLTTANFYILTVDGIEGS